MKYLYRAMASGQNCTKLLQWHEKLYEKVRKRNRSDIGFSQDDLQHSDACARSVFVLFQDGSGIIMRTLVDRKING